MRGVTIAAASSVTPRRRSAMRPVAVNTTSGTSALFGKTGRPSRRVALTAWRCARTARWLCGVPMATAQLGDNTTTQRNAPVAVNTAFRGVGALGKTVTAVAAGIYHSLALCSDGTVAAWGYNGQGQLGDTTNTQRNAPVAVNRASGTSVLFGKTVTAIAAGGNFSLALCSDGTVAAWVSTAKASLATTRRRIALRRWAVKHGFWGVGAFWQDGDGHRGGELSQLGAVLGRHGGRVGLQRRRPARCQHDDTAHCTGGGEHGFRGVGALWQDGDGHRDGGTVTAWRRCSDGTGGRVGLQCPLASSATTRRRIAMRQRR
jgi:hypothetical protein